MEIRKAYIHKLHHGKVPSVYLEIRKSYIHYKDILTHEI